MRFIALSLSLALLAGAQEVRPPYVPTSQYEIRELEGWTVHVNRTLLGEQADLGKKALRLLELKLFDVARAVPARACAELKKVPVWLGVNEGTGAGAEYHPSAAWLREHGHNPDKAKGVEIGSAEKFLKWSHQQPSMVLHELAHAYHDRVLGFDHDAIAAAYKSAVEAGTYESVLHIDGKRRRHYALTDRKEYFAEGTEAFFGTNDFYPFVRAELKVHDPGLFGVLEKVWAP